MPSSGGSGLSVPPPSASSTLLAAASSKGRVPSPPGALSERAPCWRRWGLEEGDFPQVGGEGDALVVLLLLLLPERALPGDKPPEGQGQADSAGWLQGGGASAARCARCVCRFWTPRRPWGGAVVTMGATIFAGGGAAT